MSLISNILYIYIRKYQTKSRKVYQHIVLMDSETQSFMYRSINLFQHVAYNLKFRSRVLRARPYMESLR